MSGGEVRMRVNLRYSHGEDEVRFPVAPGAVVRFRGWFSSRRPLPPRKLRDPGEMEFPKAGPRALKLPV